MPDADNTLSADRTQPNAPHANGHAPTQPASGAGPPAHDGSPHKHADSAVPPVQADTSSYPHFTMQRQHADALLPNGHLPEASSSAAPDLPHPNTASVASPAASRQLPAAAASDPHHPLQPQPSPWAQQEHTRAQHESYRAQHAQRDAQHGIQTRGQEPARSNGRGSDATPEPGGVKREEGHGDEDGCAHY